jgi:hypothetical protein
MRPTSGWAEPPDDRHRGWRRRFVGPVPPCRISVAKGLGRHSGMPTAERGSRCARPHAGRGRKLRDDFVAAAVRAGKAGFDGAEIHGAHGYVISAFLSPEVTHRSDCYGGSSEKRSRLLFEIIDGIRAACRSDFRLGVRLSPERYAQHPGEIVDLSAEVMRQGKTDYRDLSLWDVAKEPEAAFRGDPA